MSMKKKKKVIIGMGDPTRNMELFNQSLGTDFCSGGALTESANAAYLITTIFNQHLFDLLDNLDFKNAYDVDLSNPGCLHIEILNFVDIRFNYENKRWFISRWYNGELEEKGEGFNSLVDCLIDKYDTSDKRNMDKSKYYVLTYMCVPIYDSLHGATDFALGDAFYSNNRDEVLNWCEEQFNNEVDFVQIVNTDKGAIKEFKLEDF